MTYWKDVDLPPTNALPHAYPLPLPTKSFIGLDRSKTPAFTVWAAKIIIMKQLRICLLFFRFRQPLSP